MNKKDQRVYNPVKISDALGKLKKKLYSGFNKSEFIVNTKWKEIVGDLFSEYRQPEKIHFINYNENKESKNEYEGILHVKIANAAALEFQHFNNKIIEKINSYLGYRAITKIVLHQVPNVKKIPYNLSISKGKKNMTINEKNVIKKTTSKIKNKDLEKALIKLGESVITYKR